MYYSATIQRGSTQKQKFYLPFNYADYASDFIATYSQRGGIVLTKKSKDLENGSVSIKGNEMLISLSQKDTNKFKVGDLDFQIKILSINGEAFYSGELLFKVQDVLNDEVMI